MAGIGDFWSCPVHQQTARHSFHFRQNFPLHFPFHFHFPLQKKAKKYILFIKKILYIKNKPQTLNAYFKSFIAKTWARHFPLALTPLHRGISFCCNWWVVLRLRRVSWSKWKWVEENSVIKNSAILRISSLMIIGLQHEIFKNTIKLCLYTRGCVCVSVSVSTAPCISCLQLISC